MVPRWRFLATFWVLHKSVGNYSYFIGRHYSAEYKYTICLLFVTDRIQIEYSAKCRYLSYSQADFEVFRPQGRHVAPIGGEIWTEEISKGPLLCAKFHPHRYNDKGIGPPKLKFLVRFDQNVEYKCIAVAYPLHDFHKICRVCTTFQDVIAVKISLDLLKGLWSCGF